VYDVFSSEAVFLAEMSGYETAINEGRGGTNPQGAVTRITRDGPMGSNREQFSGKYVKHAIVTAGLPGGGQVQEGSTWNVAQALPVTEVHIPRSCAPCIRSRSPSTSSATRWTTRWAGPGQADRRDRARRPPAREGSCSRRYSG
jgi:hypothetical protein